MWQPRRVPFVDFPASVILAGLSLLDKRPLEGFVRQTSADVEANGKFRQLDVLYTSFYPPPFFWEYRCSTCRLFEELGSCQWVNGEISRDGWCTLWVPPEPAEPPFSWLGRPPDSLLPSPRGL